MILGVYNIQESQNHRTGRNFKIVWSKLLILQMRKATQNEEMEIELQRGRELGREWQESQRWGEWRPDLT